MPGGGVLTGTGDILPTIAVTNENTSNTTGIIVSSGIIASVSATVIFYYNNETDLSKRISQKAEVVTPLKKPYKPVVFPVDPNAFNPLGLLKVPRPGTKNGRIISWMEPLTNIEVFRWDENLNKPNGPHYHIRGVEKHFYPGDTVLEPFATIYFPFN